MTSLPPKKRTSDLNSSPVRVNLDALDEAFEMVELYFDPERNLWVLEHEQKEPDEWDKETI